MKKLLIALLFISTPTFAQQQQQISPAEAALQINTISGAMAQNIIQQGKLIEQLQKENNELKKTNGRT